MYRRVIKQSQVMSELAFGFDLHIQDKGNTVEHLLAESISTQYSNLSGRPDVFLGSGKTETMKNGRSETIFFLLLSF